MVSEVCSSSNGCEAASEAPQKGYKRYVRNIFTGELEERTDNPQDEFNELNRKSREKTEWMTRKSSRHCNPWWSDSISRPLSLPPEEATPERIAAENEAAQRHRTGAWFDKEGVCRTPTRRSRNREMARRGRIDLDAGYGDRS